MVYLKWRFKLCHVHIHQGITQEKLELLFIKCRNLFFLNIFFRITQRLDFINKIVTSGNCKTKTWKINKFKNPFGLTFVFIDVENVWFQRHCAYLKWLNISKVEGNVNLPQLTIFHIPFVMWHLCSLWFIREFFTSGVHQLLRAIFNVVILNI